MNLDRHKNAQSQKEQRKRNGEKQLLSENESTFIPLGCKHRLSNPGKMRLELIEVQSGTYLDEEDIIRFEDSYGRIKNQN